jgi:hypothetical protein
MFKFFIKNFFSFNLFFFIGLLVHFSYGQVNEFKSELSSKKINTTIQDSYGLTWIATEEGLNMFDGKIVHNFESILADNSTLVNNSILNIIELSNKELLFISKDGISVFNRDLFNFKRVKIPVPISILADDINKKIFITTSFSGVYILDFEFNILNNYKSDPLNLFSISTNSFERRNRQKSIKIINDKGDIAFGVSNGINVYSSNKDNFERFLSDTGVGSELNVLSILSDNKVLIGSNSGLMLFNYEEKSFQNFEEFNNTNIIDIFTHPVSVDVDIEGQISSDLDTETAYFSFVLTESGLFRLSIDYYFEILSIKKIYENQVKNLDKLSVSDKHFFLWGSNRAEVIKFDFFGNLIEGYSSDYPLNYLCINKNEDLFFSSINGLYTTLKNPVFVSNKNILVGQTTDERQIRFYKAFDTNNFILVDKEFIYLSKNNLNTSKKLEDFFDKKSLSNILNGNISFQNNQIFILATDALKIININDWSLKTISLPNYNLSYNKIKIINEKGYFSFSNGIVELDFSDNSFRKFEHDDLFNNQFPRGFSDIEFIDGKLWISNLESGLHTFDGTLNSEAVYLSSDLPDSTKIQSFSVNKILYDKNKQHALLSTNGDGLFIYSNIQKKFIGHFTQKDGLLSNNIIDSKFGDNFIWVLTNKGLNYFEENEKFMYVVDQNNGLSVLVYNEEPLSINIKESVGEDDFGFSENENEVFIEVVGAKNIFNFHKDKIIDDNQSYDINLLNLKLFNFSREFSYKNIVGGQLNIDSDIDFIELQMFTNNKNKRDQVEYFFSSSATNNQFVSNGYNNSIRIQSIPNYNSDVRVKAVNKSSLESSNVISFVIKKTPPLYQRVESIIAYIILLLVSVILYSKWREKATSKKLEDERRNQELEEARKLQNSLLPKKIPTRKEYDISVYLKSATEVGGDYYDFIENENKDLYAICGDATGHGVVSGIMVSVTKAGLNGIKMADPSTILNNLNSIVKRVNFGRLRMSLSVAKINNGSIELSSAAMPPTYYYNAKKNNVEEILVPNLPLGGIEGEKFDGVKKDFKKGDVVVMISDGLPELPNKEDILLDYPKVLECIENNCNESADGIKDALVKMSDNWADGLMNPDDITIVVIKKAS